MSSYLVIFFWKKKKKRTVVKRKQMHQILLIIASFAFDMDEQYRSNESISWIIPMRKMRSN